MPLNTALLASALARRIGLHLTLPCPPTLGPHLEPGAFAAVIFDCDGVLVDSEGQHAEAWVRAFHDAQLPFTPDDYLAYVGFDDAYLVARQGCVTSAKQASALIASKRRHYTLLQQAQVTAIAPGVALVHSLRARRAALGYKLALASSSPRAEIAHNLTALGLTDAFDAVVSGSDDLHDVADPEGVNKPKPYIYRRVAQSLNVLPHRSLVFEDTPAGVRAAHDAGMTVCAVPNRWTAHMQFQGADAVVPSLSVFAAPSADASSSP